MDSDEVWRTTDEQRASLADLIEAMTPEQWETPSLCEGWRVGDVAAHLTLAHTSWSTVMVEIVRARGSFDRMVHDTAVRAGGEPPAVYAERLRAMVGSRRRAPVVSPLEPMLDTIVHGQDMAIPLGIARPVPAQAAAVAAQRAWDMGFPFGAKRRLRGLRLEADDTDWAVGEDAPVVGPICALLLLVTGRTAAAVPHLTGAGTPLLAR